MVGWIQLELGKLVTPSPDSSTDRIDALANVVSRIGSSAAGTPDCSHQQKPPYHDPPAPFVYQDPCVSSCLIDKASVISSQVRLPSTFPKPEVVGPIYFSYTTHFLNSDRWEALPTAATSRVGVNMTIKKTVLLV